MRNQILAASGKTDGSTQAGAFGPAPYDGFDPRPGTVWVFGIICDAPAVLHVEWPAGWNTIQKTPQIASASKDVKRGQRWPKISWTTDRATTVRSELWIIG